MKARSEAPVVQPAVGWVVQVGAGYGFQRLRGDLLVFFEILGAVVQSRDRAERSLNFDPQGLDKHTF